MNISEQLVELNNIKIGIKEAVEEKGVDIPEGASFRSYIDYIGDISGGGGELITKTITENGTYLASEDEADGYSEVTVNVPTATDRIIISTQAKDVVTRTFDETIHCYYGEYSGTATGSLVNDNGILSNFSSSNYWVLPEPIPMSEASTFEMVLKVGIGTNSGTLIGTDVDSLAQMGFVIRTDGGDTLFLWGTTDHSSFDISRFNTGLSLASDNYYKMVYDGTKYTFFQSTDGATWLERNSLTSTPIASFVNSTTLGAIGGSVYYLSGSIDLSGCYININGSRWWTGMTKRIIF